MNYRQSPILAVMLALLITAAAPAAKAQTAPSEYAGAAALGLELRRLGTSKRVLMIAAHPDDENTAVLSTLVLGQGVQAAYLSLTRGEGGQNGIGPELQESLGIVRTEELLAARRLDGAGQFFSRAYDFGFSKTAEETFRHWPRDSILADVVAVVRSYRPDVIISVFSGTPRDGHGHHQAAGLLAREAFEAAGDPARFPEQVAQGLPAHSPTSLYQSLRGDPEGRVVRLDTGELDPLIERSHHQVAMAGRSRHRSQDMGQPEDPGPQATMLEQVAGPEPVNADQAGSLFVGADTTLSARALSLEQPDAGLVTTLEEYEQIVAAVRDQFNPLASERIAPGLAEAVRLLESARSLADAVGDARGEQLRFLIEAEASDANAALARAAGVVVDATADVERIVPGQTFSLELTLWDGGTDPVAVDRLEPLLPHGWTADPADPLPAARLAPGELLSREFRVQASPDALPTEPYYLTHPREGSYYQWPEWIQEDGSTEQVRGQPFEPPPVAATAQVVVADVAVELEREAVHRQVDRRSGEERRPLLVVPAVSVALDPDVSVLPLEAAAGVASPVPDGQPAASPASDQTAPLRFSARVVAEQPDGIRGMLRLELPAGWSADPGEVPLSFGAAGEEATANFSVTAAPDATPGHYRVQAFFQAEDGRRFDHGYQIIAYPHTRARPLYQPAEVAVPAFEVGLPPSLRVGYILGGGDRVPPMLEQLGVTVELLDADALARAALEDFDAIVAGPRTYDVRPDLVANNRRILDYVERGGTFIVQFNQYGYSEGGYAPYPLSIARPHDRVTDHESPVTLLDSDHRVLVWPNRITEADFDGWVQERGLYFANTWDERYTPLIELEDPGEDPVRGGLLVAEYGEGIYVYTGLSLFRQLPAGVPGGYRLFANLLSLGAER